MQTCIHSGHSDSNRLICSVGSSSLVVKKPETKTSSSRPLGPGNLKYPFERKAKEFNFVYIPPLPPQNQYSIFLSSPNFASSCEVVVIATNTAKGLPVQTSYSRVRLHKCQPEYKNIATGETSWAIASSHFLNYFHFFDYSCISWKFYHQVAWIVAPLAIFENLATRWRNLY